MRINDCVTANGLFNSTETLYIESWRPYLPTALCRPIMFCKQ